MSVMMVSEVGGQTPEGYDAMLGAVDGAMRQAPGFILHMSHVVEDGWRVIELWESKEDAARFFAAHVAPKLPAGIRPKLTFLPLHSLVRPEAPLPPAGNILGTMADRRR